MQPKPRLRFVDRVDEAIKNQAVRPFAWIPDCPTFEEQQLVDRSLAEWLIYLKAIGEHQIRARWKGLARDGKPMTLPTPLPDQFDLQYVPPSSRQWHTFPRELWAEKRKGRHASEQTLEERRATVEEAMVEVRKAARHMEMFPNEPRRKDQPAEPPAKTLEDLRREAVENPVRMSPGLAARLQL